jgi:hypothetical protein
MLEVSVTQTFQFFYIYFTSSDLDTVELGCAYLKYIQNSKSQKSAARTIFVAPSLSYPLFLPLFAAYH